MTTQTEPLIWLPHGIGARTLRSWKSACRVAGRMLVPWLLPMALLALWQLATTYGWVAEQMLPPPGVVYDTFMSMLLSGELWDNLAISLQRVFTGFAIGLGLGVVLGGAMGVYATLRDYLYPLFKAFSQVPVLGWLPLLMLLVGIDEELKYLLIAKATLVPVVINTCRGIQGVPNRYIEVARVHGFTWPQLLRRVVLPAAAAPIWTGVRHSLTHAWLALVVVELLASSEGVGFLIVYGRQLFQLDVVLAVGVAIGVVGYVFDRLLALVERWLLRWRQPGL